MVLESLLPAEPSGVRRHAGIGVRCQNVVHIYTTVAGHDVVALRGVNLDIAPGEQVALLGPSGSGKSTLLGLFGGLQRASAGNVIVDGIDISRIPEAELTRLRAGKVASLLQGARRNLLTYATAAGNVGFARRGVQLRWRSYEVAALRVVGVRRRDLRRAIVTEYVALLGMAVVGGALAAVASLLLVLPSLDIGTIEDFDPGVDFGLRWLVMAGVLGVVMVVVLAIAWWISRRTVKLGTPATLRQADAR